MLLLLPRLLAGWSLHIAWMSVLMMLLLLLWWL